MYYGQFNHTLDKKDRLILPSKHREVARKHKIKRFFLTRGLDSCLFLFAESQWKLYEERFASLSFTRRESRQFNRLFFSGAQEIIPDSQGRILIPSFLKEYAHISKNIIIVGVSDRIEIWAQSIWEEFYKKHESKFEDVAEKIIE